MLDMMTLIYRVQYGGRKGHSAARRLLRKRAAYPTANPDWVSRVSKTLECALVNVRAASFGGPNDDHREQGAGI